jgi:predicted aspartyl protease
MWKCAFQDTLPSLICKFKGKLERREICCNSVRQLSSIPMPVRASANFTRASFIPLAGCLALIAACQRGNGGSATLPTTIASPLDQVTSSPVVGTPISDSTAAPFANPASQPAPDLYVQAIDRAKRAFALSQSAQSKDDWQLVTERWQQATRLMAAIPQSDPHWIQAQKKLGEYRRDLAFAQQQANRSTVMANPDGIIVFAPQTGYGRSNHAQSEQTSEVPAASRSSPSPAAPAVPRPTQAGTQAPTLSNSKRTFSVPIVRRAGNTPVVNVRFNDSQTFEMIVDTGASGTLITHSMADALGVVSVAETSVDTASARDVKVPLGYVGSMNVGGATAQHVLVAIAGSELSLGLLGHDFFGNYDVTIRESRVEFQER